MGQFVSAATYDPGGEAYGEAEEGFAFLSCRIKKNGYTKKGKFV